MSKEILSLPQEVLRHVFKFLNNHHRLIASRVCKTWLNAIDCPQLLCDIEIKFKENIETFQLFFPTTRQYRWFSFYSVTLDKPVLEFLNQYSNQLFKLYFINCPRDKFEKIPPNITLICNNLKHLRIENSSVVDLFAPLPNVTILEYWPSNMSDYTVSQLCKCVFNLEALSLGGEREHSVEQSQSVYKVRTIQRSPSKLVLCFASVKMLLENNRNTLISLDLQRSHLSEEALEAISEIPDLKLRRVGFPYVGFKCIRKFFENQVSLTSLNLRSVPLEDEAVFAICMHFPNLQELDISTNCFIDKCIVQVFQLEHLLKLDIELCQYILELSYREAISNLKTFKLRHLNLGEANISDESMFELLKCNPNIRSLDVSKTSVSNKTLNMICKKLLFLEYLCLADCHQISDAGLTGEVEPDSDTFTLTPLSNLKNLIKLDLSANPFLTMNACLKVIRFPQLENLLPPNREWVSNNNFRVQMEEQNPCLLSIYCNPVVFEEV